MAVLGRPGLVCNGQSYGQGYGFAVAWQHRIWQRSVESKAAPCHASRALIACSTIPRTHLSLPLSPCRASVPQVLGALFSLAKGRTCVVVAHRLSTAAQCDQIVVLEQASRGERGRRCIVHAGTTLLMHMLSLKLVVSLRGCLHVCAHDLILSVPVPESCA